MAEYDDGAYYEVQLNNKQLVFFFMAALAMAVVVFLCGVMVGRGVRDATLAVAQNDIADAVSRTASATRTASPAPARPELDYAPRLERDDVPKALEPNQPMRPVESTSPENELARARSISSGASTADRAPVSVPKETPVPAKETPTPEKRPPSAVPASSPAGSLGSENGAFTIQVVALKTEEAAESLLTRLRGKNYRAYLEDGGDAGLHRVRVGRFNSRAEAEAVAARLRDEEKFRPYITQ